MIGSFEVWYIDRNNETPITMEGTYTADYVRKYVSDAVQLGFKAERYDGFARLIFESHEDGRPWEYSEFYPIEQEGLV